jgi:hypothetical protein
MGKKKDKKEMCYEDDRLHVRLVHWPAANGLHEMRGEKTHTTIQQQRLSHKGGIGYAYRTNFLVALFSRPAYAIV